MANDWLKSNLGTIGAGVGGAALGGILGYAAGRKSRKKRRTRRSYKRKYSRKRSYTYKRRYRRTPYTARKRKDTSHRRIRYTKRGQPYIILRSGKARFLKKSSARRSHKRKGGRY